MTSTILFKFLIEFLAICGVTYLVYRREAVARFEKKAWVYIKSFFLAARDVIKDAKAKKKPAPKGRVVSFEAYDLGELIPTDASDLEIGVA